MFNIPTQVPRFHRWKNWKRWCPKHWKQLRTVPGRNLCFELFKPNTITVYTTNLSGQWRVYATSIGMLFNCCWFWYGWWLRNPVFTKCVISMKPSENGKHHLHQLVFSNHLRSMKPYEKWAYSLYHLVLLPGFWTNSRSSSWEYHWHANQHEIDGL